MSIKFTSIKCPGCGATINNIEEDSNETYCPYCGAKILINNENEYVYRNIDEAAVKQAETDRIVKLKQMEIAEKERESNGRIKATKLKLALALGIIGIIFLIIGNVIAVAPGDPNSNFYMLAMVGFLMVLGAIYLVVSASKNNHENDPNYVKIPDTVIDYKKKSYQSIEAILKSAGFTNIKCVPLNDLTTGFLKKPDMVESITINDTEVTSGGKRFPRDASVVILYHSFEAK